MVGRDSRCGAATRLRGVRCPRRRGLRRVPGAAGQDGGVRHAGHIHGSGIRVCMVQGRGASGDSGVEGPSRRGMRRAAVRGDGRAGRPVSAGDGGRDAYRPGGSGAVLIGFGAPAGTAAYRRAGGCRGASVSGYGGRCACGSPAHDGPCPRTVRADGRRSAQPARQRAHLVVDDIVTTGATMRQCVDALRSSGAQVVTCLSVAYTPQPDAATVRDSVARDDTSAA